MSLIRKTMIASGRSATTKDSQYARQNLRSSQTIFAQVPRSLAQSPIYHWYRSQLPVCCLRAGFVRGGLFPGGCGGWFLRRNDTGSLSWHFRCLRSRLAARQIACKPPSLMRASKLYAGCCRRRRYTQASRRIAASRPRLLQASKICADFKDMQAGWVV